MKGTVRGGTVPITISHRKVTKQPEVERHRRFVGWRRMFANIAIKVIEAIEDVAYETESEVIEAGEQEVVHWAVDIDDPFTINPTTPLRAVRVPERPPAGISLEVVRIVDSGQETTFNNAAPKGSHAPRRPDHRRVRERMREALKEDGHYDPEIGPGSVDEAFDEPPTPSRRNGPGASAD